MATPLDHSNIEDRASSSDNGSIFFSNGTQVSSDVDNFFYDSVNKYFALGTKTPTSPYHMEKTYTDTSGATTNFIDINVDTPAGNDTAEWAGYSIDMDNTHDRSGIIEDASVGTKAFVTHLNISGDTSADWQDGNEDNISFKTTLQRSGAATGTRHFSQNVGHQMLVTDNMGYNNAGGTYQATNIGNKVTVQANGTVTAGTVNRFLYGEHITVSSNAGGTISNYGLYVDRVSGADNNYGLYVSDTDLDNYIAYRLGINQTSPIASLHVTGSFATKTTTVTATSDTLDTTDHKVLVDDDTAGAQVTITLPAASGNDGLEYYIKKIGSTANVVVDGNGSETIDGGTTATLTTQYESINITCDGSNWYII